MPSPYLYYTYAFGQNADDVPASIPMNAAGDGSVSYYAGWTDPYEYNLLTNPAALPIPRGQMNQLFYDITNNLQQYQQFGTPIWVTGNTVSYPIYSRVYYSGVVYESQISNNTNTPGTDSTWRVISGNVGGVPIGTVIDFAGANAPTDFIICDGSGISRSTYAGLMSAITQTQNGTTVNTMNTLTGLSDTSKMYIGMHLEGIGIPGGTTLASIVSSSSITMSATATASATVAVTFFNWGNGDGSTTFNIPDQRRYTKIGSGGTGSIVTGGVAGTITGQSGGQESHTLIIAEMPSHTHTPTAGNGNLVAPQSPGGTVYSSGGQGAPCNLNTTGNDTAHNNTQPSNIYTQCIKYQ